MTDAGKYKMFEGNGICITPFSRDAEMLLVDLKEMYPDVGTNAGHAIETRISQGVHKVIANLSPGTVMIVACRDKSSIDTFELEAMMCVALKQKQSFLLHGSSRRNHQLLRAYLETVAGVCREDRIYDGEMGRSRVGQSIEALKSLSQADIRIAITRGSFVEGIAKLTDMDYGVSSGAKLLYCGSLGYAFSDLIGIFPRLRDWASREKASIIVTCLLDERAMPPFQTVTRDEYSMLQRMNEAGFELQLMEGAGEGIRFSSPKVSPRQVK